MLKNRFKFKITTKVLILLLGLSFLSLVLFVYISISSMKSLCLYALEGGKSLGESAVNDSKTALEKLGENAIKQKAVDVAKQIEIYLKDRPNMTKADIRNDNELRKIAVQPVGTTGYTAVVDADVFVILIHKFPQQEGKDLIGLKSVLPTFWSIVESSAGGKESSGYYDWREVDGSMKKKYAHIAPINVITADGKKGLTLWSTTYIDEFSKPIEETKSKITAATLNLVESIDNQKRKVRNILIGSFVIMIFVVSVISYRLAKRITKPILALDKGANIVGSGNLDYNLEVKTGDEIEDLARTFNKMTYDLKIYIKDLKETTAAKERIESELKIAHDIQISLVPRIFPPFPNRKEFDLFATLEPAKEVGGDFYDFFFIDENNLCFCIGDVSGKGVPASLFMAVTRTLIRTKSIRGLTSDKVLIRVNEDLCVDNDTCMFVTIFCAILNIETGEMEYANGGHNPPLFYRNGGEFSFMEVNKGMALGVMEDAKVISSKLKLKPNDTILLYTDGVNEAMNPEGEQFSNKRFKEALSNGEDINLMKLLGKIGTEVKKFTRDAPQSDDITMLALKYNGNTR